VPVVVAMFALASRRTVGFRGLLVVTYAGLAAVTTLQVLAAPTAPYIVVDLLLVCCVALTHPLPVAMPFAGVMAVSRIGAAFFNTGDRTGALVHAAMEAVIWTVLAAALCGVMLQVREQRLQLRDERSVDPLTGLLNRLAFDEYLDTQISAHRGSGEPLSLIVGDVNGFKQLNDGYGHLEGDRQLKAVAGAIASAVRAGDTCFRWGGDEFAVVLPDADSATAEVVGSRLRAAVAAACAAPEPLTIAVGHATLGPDDDADSLTARADAMLFERKRLGSPLAVFA
jgi:diguanylate cyclase (GGDEF)-like protein